ncbi:MAG: APC family permease [Deltaproteobacteria bacterium]|nr:APC family permease [Deltaproteobacteria bacterium]
MVSAIQKMIIGNPLPTKAHEHERLSKTKALAVFSSDALSSVAYATEEILLVLVLAGTGALAVSMPIAVVICILLVLVVSSYYQTIQAYPAGAGSYNVSRENLGTTASLIAAAALLVDYVLTVAVSISAGVVALTSAFPELLPWKVKIGLLLIALITLGNLRGVRESGTIFAIPTYIFIASFSLLIVAGLFRLWTGDLVMPTGVAAVSEFASNHAELTWLLILRAFASGCTALTGIEAISDGVPAFRKPESRNAGITLILMGVLLTTMFVGITYLASQLHIVPRHDESVVSQIARHIFGNGWMYFLLQASTTLILILAANTSFADFPRLAQFVARDGFLPRQMTNLGDRLVYSNGVGVLAILASLLVWFFHGNPHRLIPLYAVGVFLSFTLSQAGMVRRWQKIGGKHWQLKAVINGIGALATGIVLLIIIESKFLYGAWIVLAIIPLLIWMFWKIKWHYIQVDREVSAIGQDLVTTHSLSSERQYKVIIPVSQINRATLGALQFARSLSKDVTAVMVDIDPAKTQSLKENWSIKVPDIQLVVLDSPYRSVIDPLLEYLDEVDDRDPDRGLAVVVLPEVVPSRWWHNLLHNQTALLLKGVLLYRGSHSGHERIVINVPYRPRIS